MRIVKHFIVALSAFCVCAIGAIAATDDAAALRSKVTALRDAVNKADAASAAALWSLDGTYLDEYGVRFAGRDAVQRMFSSVFGANTKPNVDLSVDRVRFVAKDVAVLDGTVRVSGRPSNAYSLTMVRSGDDWQISSGTETKIVSTSANTEQPLKALNWIIGNWRAQSTGGTVDMKAEWIGQNHFILCRYETTKSGQPKQVEGQIIGWDPRAQKPISWHFNSDGGYGQGVWNHAAGKWTVDLMSTGSDGSMFTATNVISAGSSDKFTWQSMNRRRNGVWLEDTAPVIVERTTK